MDMQGHDMGDMNNDADAQDPPDIHGMAVIGQKSVFLSHLPMFGSPHDYQVIVEAELTKTGADPQQVYFDDRKQNPGEKLYTFKPNPFVLPHILPTDGNPPQETTFAGALSRGHYERPQTNPQKIASGVTVRVKNVIFGRRFIPDAHQPKKLEYILFGRGDEVFLAHAITSPPDFDQLIQVTLDQNIVDDGLLEGHPVTIPSRSNNADERILTSGGTIEGIIHFGEGTSTVNITPGVEFYFEERELAG
jgi:hypothetical protein